MNKKLFLGMFAAAGMLLATSCSNDELDMVQSGNEAQVTFSLGLEGSIATRAISDGTGAKTLICAVYDANDANNKVLLDKVVINDEQVDNNGQYVNPSAFQGGLKDNVRITLAKGQTYTMVFWAQNGACGAYDTDDLTAVKVSYKAENGTDNASNNDETRDAFYAAETFKVEGNKEINVTLKRPFAQINVGVTKEDWEAADASGITIEKSSVVIKNAATSINLLTGEVGDETTDVAVTYTANTIPQGEMLKVDTDGDGKDEEYHWLSMSYILVADHDDTPENGLLGTKKATLQGLQYTFTPTSGQPITFEEGLAGAPVRRNWRTNILGKLLTGDVQFNITIDPAYNDDYIYPNGSEIEQELEFAATFGGTVTLTEDVTLTKALNVNADMILNLGNYTISNANDYAIENTGNLTINAENGGISGMGGIRSKGGKITINGGTYTGSSDWNNNTYQHILKAENTEVIINGGTFDATIDGITNAMINVSTGSKVTINGGEFRNVDENTTIPQFAPYMFTYEKDGKLIINDGEFYGGWRFNGETATTDIYGGNFTVSYDGQSFNANSTHVLTVYGGTFSLANGAKLNPTIYVAEDYQVIETDVNGTKYYSVVPAGKTYENPIVTAEQLKALGNTSVSGTYNLLADIDMTGIEMQPIQLASGANNSLVFNGNGHTIKNLNLVQAYQNGMYVAGLFNILHSGKEITVKDLKIVNAKSVSEKYAAIVLAYNSTTTTINLDNVDVDIIPTIQAETVSPLVGYTTGPVNLTNCDVKNITMTGEKPEKVGAFVGSANQSTCVVTVNNCTNNSEYKAAGRVINGATMTIDGQNYVTTTDALNEALANGAETIILPAGEFSADLGDAQSRSLTIIGTEGTEIQFENLGGQNSLPLNKLDNLTIRDCKIGKMLTKNWGMLVFGSSNNANGVYTIENCTFDGVSTTGIYINEDVSGATYNILNCKFNGDFGAEGAITIENNSDVNHIVNVKGCTFNNIPDTSHKIFVHYAYNGWTLNTDVAASDVYWKANQQ